MKKRIALFLSLLMVSGLMACGSQSGTPAAAGESTAEESVQEAAEAAEVQPETAAEETEQTASEADGEAAESSAPEETEGLPEEEAEREGKTLVVYYSASGHTETVAEYIAAATGADVFALKPAEPYTDGDLDWTDDSSRVVYEHDNPDAREVELVTASVPGWEEYDTVFIGYPIWWGIAAWPVDGFVEANDFTGKTVIPFCTSSSSDLGESGELLAEAAGTGSWMEGERFSSGAGEAEVREWVDSLGLTAE